MIAGGNTPPGTELVNKYLILIKYFALGKIAPVVTNLPAKGAEPEQAVEEVVVDVILRSPAGAGRRRIS